MTKGIIVQGDGIVITCDLNDAHTIEQPNFSNAAFTPHAAFDAQHGRKYQQKFGELGYVGVDRGTYETAKANNSHDFCRCLVGTSEPRALTFKREQQRINLLNKISPGIEVTDGEFRSVHVVGRGSPFIVTFRLGTLQWRVISEEQWLDFPQYLQKHFLIDRHTAWRLAWALVRAVYLDEALTITRLLTVCVKEKRGSRDPLDDELASAIQSLKAKVLV